MNMKNITLFASLAIFMASCSDVLVDNQDYNYSDNEGGVSIAIETKSVTKAGSSISGSADELFSNSVLKIYDSNDALIRNYDPATESPETIALISGDYNLTLDLGSGVVMTTDKDDLSYYGESDFAITAGSTTAVGVTCNILNTVVTINFDETTLDEYLAEGYKVTLVAGDAITSDMLADSYQDKLTLTADGSGYFILDDDSKSIAWQFDGVRVGDGSAVSVSGVIGSANAGEENILTFRYDYENQALNLLGDVTVDTTTVEFNDDFYFTYEEEDKEEEDKDDSGDENTEGTSSIGEFSNIDLWNNTATVSASIFGDYTTAAVEFRASGEDSWESFELVATGVDNEYSASIKPEWTAEVNEAGLTQYTPSGGVWAGGSYECRLVVDGVSFESKEITINDGVQTIPDGDMNSSSLYCYSTSNGGSSWDSGNFTALWTTYKLCSQATVNGATCAKLATTTVVSVIAAGNVFYGDFKYSSFTGTVSFGRPFTWESRPRSLKLKYAASLATGSITDPAEGGETYSQDRGRIFLAIVDWDSQHATASGASDPTGVWDPTTQTSTAEGDIIGYASMFVDESTSTDELIQLELPIYYYDTETIPTKDYTIVISCASSAYGDYKVGVSGSTMYVDDFELGY